MNEIITNSAVQVPAGQLPEGFPEGHATGKAVLFYFRMRLIRSVEQRLLDLYAEGRLTGTVHTSIGQEASAVGVVDALDRERDVIFSSHRAHGHFLAYCDEVEGMIAEVMGKETGVCGGIGGTQHLHKRNMYTNGIQGGIAPNAVGAALAEKLKGTGAISVVFLGDGTMGQGSVYESFNIASLWELPVLFVLEDNGIAQTTPKRLQHAGELYGRAESFGIQSGKVVADDVCVVHDAAQDAVRYVRDESRPFFLAVETFRHGPHSKGDDTRSREEVEGYLRRDPLVKIAGELDAEERRLLDAAVERRVDQAVEKANAAKVMSVDGFVRGRG